MMPEYRWAFERVEEELGRLGIVGKIDPEAPIYSLIVQGGGVKRPFEHADAVRVLSEFRHSFDVSYDVPEKPSDFTVNNLVQFLVDAPISDGVKYGGEPGVI